MTVAASWHHLLRTAHEVSMRSVPLHKGRAEEDKRTWAALLKQGAEGYCPVCGEKAQTERGFCCDGCEYVHLSKKVEGEHGYVCKI